jgi:hypothetical protein
MEGDPEKAYQAALELQAAYHEALAEGSRLRFKVNFGTEVCNRCEGLRAGPGVAATCFQIQRCDYTNVKEEAADPRHQRLIASLTGKARRTP